MRVNEAGCVGERHMVADQLFGFGDDVGGHRGDHVHAEHARVSGLAASQPETMVNEPAVPLISMRAFASIG